MMMRALSLTQPWANMVAQGTKTIETRRWSTVYRGWFLVCSTKQRVEACAGPYGVALAVAAIVDCRRMVPADEPKAQCPIYRDAWAWVLDGVQPLPAEARFYIHGQLGLFAAPVPPVHELLVRRLMETAIAGKSIDITTAVGCFDVQCRHCGKRFGWQGRLADRPPCPRCGTGPT
jgi:hypothetical protein